MRGRGVAVPLAAGLGLALATGLVAVPASEAQPVMVRFGVGVIEASNSPPPPPAPSPFRWSPVPPPPAPPPPAGPRVDDPLQRVLPHLQRLFRYEYFRTVAKLRSEGPLGVEQRVMIPGNASLDLVPERLEANRVLMRLLLREGRQVEIRTSILASPGAPAIVGGPPRGDGVLIIVLWARPAP